MDYYSTREECEKASRTYVNSNPRYRNFCQTHFTAGDEEQFQTSRDWSNANADEGISQTKYSFDIWSGNSNLTGDAITNTFSYIFDKFKKGIYIRIKDNKLKTFLPFSKAKFTNEWSERISIDPKYASLNDFMKHICEMEGRHFNEKRVNKFVDEWYANNCLLRYEFPISEGDTGTSHIRNMFIELCENRKVPDMEFFVNRRDFPILKRDATEPYNHIYDSEEFPLISHRYEKYAPILSSTTCDNFADIPIPTIDDWARVKAPEGAFFEKTHNRDYNCVFDTPWEQKKPIAVFRGGSTGAGTTIATNPRLRVAKMSSDKLKDPNDGLLYLDAGITDWNLRPRKLEGEPYLKTIEIKDLPFGLVPKLTPEEQSRYKYIVHIQGHSAAFRLSLEMSMGCVILLVETKYNLWFSRMIKPYEHYIPVKSDLSDLVEKIRWCKENDGKCKKISENAKTFFQENLSKDGIFDYLQSLLSTTKKVVGNYKYPKRFFSDIQIEEESSWVSENFSIENVKGERKTLTKTKHTEIFEVDGRILKKTTKQKEAIHEAFVYARGLSGCQNFCEIFGVQKDSMTLCRKYDGKTFFEWLKTDFSQRRYVSILSDLTLALEKAQNKCGFVHNDLFPWNVVIGSTPIIIDYGKSHIIADGVHHGMINPYKMDSLYDILCIVLSSIAVLLKEKISRKDEEFLVYLVNFFSHSKILPVKLSSFPKMRHFVLSHSSFSTLSSLKDLNIPKTPRDFFNYINNIRVDTMPPQNQAKKPLPKLEFKNIIYVYYFFQRLNDPSFEKEFKMYLESVGVEEFEEVQNMPNEIFLNPLKVEEMILSKPTIEEMSLIEKVLKYKGVYEVTGSHYEILKRYECNSSPFKVLQQEANMATCQRFKSCK